MKINPFKLERYFAKYEFTAPYLLSSSDCEPISQNEILSLADKETKALWENLKLGYTESQGHPILRAEISKIYKNISPEQVLVIAPQEGIFLTTNSILEKGDHVIVTFPAYQSLYEVATYLGCSVTKWTPNEKDWSFDVNFLKSAIKNNTKLIVINFPHNPTGSLISKESFTEILNIARKKNIFVFSDEMYRYLEYDESERLDSASDLYENAISLFGVSKSFGLAGLRTGWLTTQNKKIMENLLIFRDYTTICASAPSEILTLIALKAKDKILKRNLEITKKNLTALNKFFARYTSTFSFVPPKAGTIGFPKFLTDVNVTEIMEDLVNKKGVLLMPAHVFDYKGNYFRIGFGRKNMPEALDKFEEYLEENKLV